MNQNEDDRTLAVKALRWVAFAYWPLGAKALQEAVAIEPGEQDFDLDTILDIDLVLDVCAGLLILDEENNIVRLVYYTAQGYFDKHTRSTFDKAHTCIARECMTYLRYECFQNPKKWDYYEDLLSTGSNGLIDNEDSLSTEPRSSWATKSRRYYYLFGYASVFWVYHATTSQDTALNIEIHKFLARVNRFCQP